MATDDATFTERTAGCNRVGSRRMLVVFRERVKPEGADVVSDTVPENPFSEPSMMVDLPEAPCWTLIVPGMLAWKKSTTRIVSATYLTRDPLEPENTMV